MQKTSRFRHNFITCFHRQMTRLYANACRMLIFTHLSWDCDPFMKFVIPFLQTLDIDKLNYGINVLELKTSKAQICRSSTNVSHAMRATMKTRCFEIDCIKETQYIELTFRKLDALTKVWYTSILENILTKKRLLYFSAS